jgi:lysophospholipase L1-like esterase
MRLAALLAAAAIAGASMAGQKGRPAPWLGSRFLAVGDSITLGAGYPGGYRNILWERLLHYGVVANFVGPNVANSGNVTSLRHAGFGGWGTRDAIYGRPGSGQGRLSDWMREYQPSVVLVMLGTNDPASWSQSDHEQNFDHLLGIVFRTRPSAKVVLSSVPGSAPQTGKAEAERRIQGAVRAVAARWRARGYPVEVADPLRRWDARRHLADAYHPNQQGYWLVADEFLRALRRLSRA